MHYTLAAKGSETMWLKLDYNVGLKGTWCQSLVVYTLGVYSFGLPISDMDLYTLCALGVYTLGVYILAVYSLGSRISDLGTYSPACSTLWGSTLWGSTLWGSTRGLLSGSATG